MTRVKRGKIAHKKRERDEALLRNDREPLSDLAAREPVERDARQPDLPMVREKRAREHTQERGLARAVRPDHDQKAPARELEIHAIEHCGRAERVSHSAGDEQRLVHDGILASSRRSSTRKSGPPTSAVSAPTGSSTGASTIRASVSATTRNAAPASAEAGTSMR